MNIFANQTLPHRDWLILEGFRKAGNKEAISYAENQTKNALSLTLVRFIEPHLPIEVEKQIETETYKTEVFVLSKPQVEEIFKLIVKISELAQFGIDGEIADSYGREIEAIFKAKTLEVEEK